MAIDTRRSGKRRRNFALVIGSGLAGAAVLWIIGLLVPAEAMLPADLPTVLVADGCHGALPHVRAASEPELEDRLLTIVIPKSAFGGSDLADFNCGTLARRVRARYPAMRLLPRRTICYRIQKWARSQLETANRSFGEVVWIIDGDIIEKVDEYPVLTQLGLSYEMLPDGGYRLVSTR
ncbi:hypothetical protein ACNOYE_36720 [Nannocystaceae bacterium ST9]